MVLVAVAGRSSPTLGKSIVKAIIATGGHQVAILSRANTIRILDVPRQTLTKIQCDQMAEEYGRKAEVAVGEGRFDLGAFMGRMTSQMMGVMCDSPGGVVESTLNKKLENAGIRLQTRTVEDLLVAAWAGRGRLH